MKAFLKDAEGLPNSVAAWVGDELPKVSEQLKKLIDQGRFDEVARTLTTSDLQRVADWYAKKSKPGMARGKKGPQDETLQ